MRNGRKILLPFLISAFCFIFVFGNGLTQESAEEVFEKAVYFEEVQGDLQKAIELYEKILTQFPENNAIAGKAQLHIGLCYEKLGKTEAIKAYELVLEKYAGHKELVDVARSRLASLRIEGSKEITVIKAEFHMHEPFEISPDGTKIVGVQIDKGQNIAVNHLGKEGLDYITDFDWGDETYWTYNPVWSRDGQEIVYLACYGGREEKKDYNLRASSLDGQQRILIKSETDWFIPLAWMPDGISILTIKGDEDNKQELGLVPSKGGEFKKLISLKGQVQVYGRSRPTACVSPDGRFIVYTDQLPGEHRELFITTSDGKTSLPLGPSPALDGSPRWSPDGKHIIFMSYRHGNGALWGVAVEEGKPVGDPFLIRDGMGSNMFGNWTEHGLLSWNWVRMSDIFLLDVNPVTGEPVGKPGQLDYTPTGSNTRPAFSPDGNHIAFMGGRRNLVVVQKNKDNTQEFQLPKGLTPRTIEWMPDGRGLGIYCRNMNGENFLASLSFDTEKWIVHPIPILDGWTTLDWAGSGKAIFYGKNGYPEDGAGIVERDLETGEEKYVYRPKEGIRVNFRALNSSRDYKKIVFVEANARGIVVDIESGESLVFFEGKFPNNSFITWSPDGERVMAVRSTEGGHMLRVYSFAQDAHEEFDLSDGLPENGRISRAKWSPKGTQVAFVLNQNISEHLIYKNIIPKNK
jgi:Tol biopolymer transport system component